MKSHAAPVVFALVVAAALALWGLDAPWDVSDQGWGGAWYSLSARNLLRYPLTTSLGAMIVQPGPVVADPALYLNHPPGIVWAVAACFAVFGEHEWAARLIPALLAIVGAGAAPLLVQGRARWVAGLAAVSSPAWAYYASMVDPQGSGVLCGVLWACVGARHRRPWLVALGLGVAMAFDWPGWVAAAAVVAWSWRADAPKAARAALLTTAVATVFMVALTAAHGGFGDLIDGFVNRAGLKPELLDDQGNLLTWGGALAQIGAHHRWGGLLLVSGAGLAAAVHVARDTEQSVLLVPLVVGVIHVAMFPQGAAVHAYWQLYLHVALGILAASWISSLPNWGVWLGLLWVPIGARSFARAQVARAWTDGQPYASRLMGEQLRALPESVVLHTPEPRSVQLMFYGDRVIDWESTEPASLVREDGVWALE